MPLWVRTSVLAFFIAVIGASLEPGAFARTITFEDRIEAQRAIDNVYWRHRVWPSENPSSKPPFAQVETEEALRAKVTEYLKKSNALERLWRRPITANQLQAELDRISKQTRDATMLDELYAALGNDAALIAETLARQTLADRLIRSWYASDDRFHGDLRRRAAAARARTRNVAEMRSMGGEYRETKFRKVTQLSMDPQPTERELLPADWNQTSESIARDFRTPAAGNPLRKLTALRENDERLYVLAVLARDDDEMTTAIVAWPKRSFDSWWHEERLNAGIEVNVATERHSLLAPNDSACTNDTWISQPGVPTPRGGHAAVWTGTEMFLWGGWDGNELANGGRYNPTTDSWSSVSTGPNSPTPHQVTTAVWTGTEVLVFGGYPAAGGRYDPETDSWSPMTLGINSPGIRMHFASVWTGTELIIWGGSDANNPVNTGNAYDPALDSWRLTSTGAGVPSARGLVTGVWTGTEMIVWGGSDNTGGRYDPVTDSWAPTSTGAGVPSGRGFHTAVWTGTEMIVWGGYNSTFLNTGARYDPTSDTWQALSTSGAVPSPRYGHTAVWTGNQMIIWGGWYSDGTSQLLNTGGRYSPSNDGWVATSTGSNVPAVRSGHSAVWTESEMIVWGGSNSNDMFANGGRYDPIINSWSVPSNGHGDPSPRTGPTTVWTGTEMIIWGGYDYNDCDNSGGRYDLATATWTPTSMGANVPGARAYHGAIWTGTEMIVWGGGGNPNFVRLFSGARYDPVTDTWTPTAAGPAARLYHSTLWTGTEMIVWGGAGSTYFNTGGRYSPTTNTWLATPVPSPALLGRVGHSAVWTGSEMIVWGGRNGNSTFVNTGGRYSPSSNSWSLTSIGAGVPTSRQSHVAVWTGTLMIVWGGGTGDACFGSGSRYSPATDKWSPTSESPGVPSARWGASGVWTGSELIVWGGASANNVAIGTGGRYDPAADSWSATSVEPDTPTPRTEPVTIWSGEEMIMWGGYRSDSGVYRYCAASCGAPAAGASSLFLSKSAAISGQIGLNWVPVATASSYDVVRGSLTSLRSSGGDFSIATNGCVADDLRAFTLADSEIGNEWYLVRPVGCGGGGSYDAGDTAHAHPRDPGILASGQNCP